MMLAIRTIILFLLTASVAHATSIAVPMSELIAGQYLYSAKKVSEKLEDRRINGIDPITVVKTPQGYVILDGHHDAMIAMRLGLTSVPVDIVEDLSNLSAVDAWASLKARNLVYLRQSPEHMALTPPRLTEMQDEPNLYLASILSMKLKRGSDGKISKVVGPRNAIWYKEDSSPVAIEIEIAGIMTAAGIRYNDKWGENVPEQVVEAARRALGKAHGQGILPRFDQIRLIQTPIRACPAIIMGFTLLSS